MLFANPIILWGLLAISIPVIIHLFNLQRYKKVYFTNVRFLQQLQQQSRRQSVLRHWLALLFRVLTIIFLVLAFAKPYIPSPLGTFTEAESASSIYIDNSFSMETEGRNGLLLDEAIDKAGKIASSLSRSERFNLLTNDFSGIHYRLVSSDEFSTFLDDIQPSPSVRNLHDVLNRQYDILNSEPDVNRTLYVISDFQRNSATLEGFVPDSAIRHFMLLLEPIRHANLSIDTCWFETPAQQPGQVVQLHATVTNHGSEARENIPVRLVINGSQRALASYNLNAGASATQVFSFTINETGLHQGFLELNDYPVTFDDRLYFSFRVLDAINVMSIFDQTPGPYLRALFGNDKLFRFSETNVRQLNFAEVYRQQLIILNGLSSISSGLASELNRFLENGGSVFIIPSANIDRTSYTNWMRSLNTITFSETDTARIRMDDLNLLHPVYKGVFELPPGRTSLGPETDLPWVSFRHQMVFPPRKDIQTLISLRNAEPFLVADRFVEGNIYVIASPLDVQASTFPIHAIFVPTLYRMALLSTLRQTLYLTVGTQEALNIGNLNPGNEQVFQISGSDGKFRFIPGHRVINYNTQLYALDAIPEAGNYFLTAGQDTLLYVSFNYDRRESVPDYLSKEELQDMAEMAGITNFAIVSESERPVGQLISELSRGKQLWKYFIIAALFFLLAEIVALRFLP